MRGSGVLQGADHHPTDCSKVSLKTLGKWIRHGGQFPQLVSQGLGREREKLDKEGPVKRGRGLMSIFRLPQRDRWDLEERGRFVVQKERTKPPRETRHKRKRAHWLVWGWPKAGMAKTHTHAWYRPQQAQGTAEWGSFRPPQLPSTVRRLFLASQPANLSVFAEDLWMVEHKLLQLGVSQKPLSPGSVCAVSSASAVFPHDCCCGW